MIANGKTRIGVGLSSSIRWCLLLALTVWGGEITRTKGEEPPHRILNIFTRQLDGVTHFYVQNLQAAAVTTTFDFWLFNMEASTDFPYTTTIGGHETMETFTLAPRLDFPICDFFYVNDATIGNAEAQHDDTYVYQLPYKPGQSFRVTQGYHGSFSHTGADAYAVDWKMPVGTPVHAARGGLVVQAKVDSDQGGPNLKYRKCANCILIEHSDGTIGIYAHLQKGGSRVQVGDHVNVGDLIGFSGNTGFTDGAHLHFAVFKTKNGSERLSLPVIFQVDEARAQALVSGRSYKAVRLADNRSPAIAPLAKTSVDTKRIGG